MAVQSDYPAKRFRTQLEELCIFVVVTEHNNNIMLHIFKP